jgi:hypothetical protein
VASLVIVPSLPANPLPVDPDLMIGLEITEAGVQPSQENPPDALPNIQLPWAGQGTIPFDPTIGDSGLWPENDRIPPEMQRSYAGKAFRTPIQVDSPYLDCNVNRVLVFTF